MSLNKVQLIGHLGKDPEVRRLNNGNQVVSFRMATSDRWRDKQTGERKEHSEWHNIVIFNENLGKVVEQYCKKGSKIYIEGKLTTRKWEKDGVERYSTEVVLQAYNGQIELLDGKGDSDDRGGRDDDRGGGRDDRGSDRGSSSSSKSKPTTTDDPDDSIPF